MADKPYMPKPLAQVPRERWPQHVAVIMDGNGRWARRRGLPRIEGHRQGGKAVRRISEEAHRLGLKQLTLYAFSSENWKRPADEVKALMDLYRKHMIEQRPLIMKNHSRLVTIGRRDGIPPEVLAEVDRTVEMSAANPGLTVCLAVNYGSRREIADAARRIAECVRRGEVEPGAITEETVSAALDTAGMPDPDLLVRTAGEMRLSNFLLWQLSYAELWVTETLWPDFSEADLWAAIAGYAKRERRFGGLGSQGESEGV
jgi:undecaprenyl diphosphate synthase